jgi:heptose-I-phosphate ethanolaminephosphotransferase
MKSTSSKSRNVLILFLFFAVTVYFVNLKQNTILKACFPSKVWVHRVNTLEKKKLLFDKYEGLEVDVEFDEKINKFQVNHPPEKPIGLYLSDYLQQEIENKRFWIDFKNLNSSNAKKAKSRLQSIVNNHGYNKGDLIIESSNLKELNAFQDNFLTSYYLPGLNSLNKLDLQDSLSAVTDNLNSYDVHYISSSLSDYRIMKKNYNSNILCWALKENSINSLSGFKNGLSYLKEKCSALLDSRVHVLLLPEVIDEYER